MFASAEAAGRDHLLDAGVADIDQGKFSRDEEGIGRHQQDHDKYPQHDQRDHGVLILAFPRGQKIDSLILAQPAGHAGERLTAHRRRFRS